MKLKKADNAVSDLVGTVLLLSMAVLFFSILSAVVLSYPTSSSSPSANLVGTIEGEYLLIEHRGGEPLSLETKVILFMDNGTSKSIVIGDENYLDDEAKKDNHWGIGEWFIYQDEDIMDEQVMITVVDVESNSVIMSGTLQGT